MRLAMTLITALTLSFGSLALASALLATTPACELLTEKQVSKAMGQAMISMGGTADLDNLSECFWQAEAGGLPLDFRLMDKAMFSPSGQTGRDYLNQNMDAMQKAGDLFDYYPQIGEGAFLSEAPDTWFVGLASGGGYLSIRLTGGKREMILAIAESAAKAMSAR